MRVCGFTFIRNAIKFDYPIREAIQSIMPLCDEIIVAVGNSDDGTRALIEEVSYKIKIVDSIWDDNLRLGGEILAQQTDLAKQHAPQDADWLFYIQGDECIHENDIPAIRKAMADNLNNLEVEGLLFKYYHFYGSFDYVGVSRKWYRKEIRIIRNDKAIHSWRDAQGFRKNGQKLKVKEVNAHVYHYGWVKNPMQQQAKQKVFHSYWHDDNWLQKNITNSEFFDYNKIDVLEKFKGQHPEVIKERISAMNWEFNYIPSNKHLTIKDALLMRIEKITGWRIGEYRNYILI